MHRHFEVQAEMWLYPGKAAWHFVTIPAKTAEEIDYFFSEAKRGWGSLRVTVSSGSVKWETSIFPDKKTQTYLLPLKAKIRHQLGVKAGDTVKFSLEIQT